MDYRNVTTQFLNDLQKAYGLQTIKKVSVFYRIGKKKKWTLMEMSTLAEQFINKNKSIDELIKYIKEY